MLYFDIVKRTPDNEYLDTLVKEGIIPSNIDRTKNYVGIERDWYFVNFCKYIDDNHIPFIDLGDHRVKTSYLEYIYLVFDEEARELERAYNKYNLTATGRTFYSERLRNVLINSIEFIYKGKKYARSSLGVWYKVLPIEFIIDGNVEDVISTIPICNSSIDYDSFKLDINRQRKDLPFNGNSSDFNIDNGVYTIKNGVMYDSFKDSRFIPYGVEKIIVNSGGSQTDYMVIPETVKRMEFIGGFTGSLYTKHLELHDGMTFGSYVRFFVTNEVVIHFKHPDSLKEFIKNFSEVVNKGSADNKLKNLVSSSRLKVILRGPVLSKQDINELKKYGYRFEFPSKKSKKSEDLVDRLVSSDNGMQSSFQMRINELTDEIMGYLSYFPDGEKRYNTIKQRVDSFIGVLTEILANNSHEPSNKVKSKADDAYNQIIRLLEEEKAKLSGFGGNCEAINFVNICEDIVHGRISVSDNDTCRKLIAYIKKMDKLDTRMRALIIANLTMVLKNEKEAIQNYLGSQNNQSNIALDSVTLNHDAVQCEASLNAAFSDIFKKIDDALEAQSVRETMRNDLFDVFQDNYDASKIRYTEFYKVTSNQISLNIKNKVGDNSDLAYFLDLRGNIVNFFFNSDVTSKPKDFAQALLSEFPELFSSIESAKVFQMAYDTRKANLMFNNEELEGLVEKYSYMTAALMLVETKLDTELENLKQLRGYFGLVFPKFRPKK